MQINDKGPKFTSSKDDLDILIRELFFASHPNIVLSTSAERNTSLKGPS